MYAPDIAVIATPLGTVRVAGDESAIRSVKLNSHDACAPAHAAAVKAAVEQLEQWFAGDRQTFELPLAPAATLRGEALRQGMMAIPYGAVESYGAFARRIASSPRAIGQACARNPFPIIVPCHRVVRATGLGHYSAGAGISTKAWLLAHEQQYRRPA